MVSPMELTNDMQRRTLYGELLQYAMREDLNKRPFTHMITLAFNTDYSLEAAEKKVQYWINDCVKRVLRGKQFQNDKNNKYHVYGFVEFNKMGYPHYHLLVNVPFKRRNWFEKVAAQFWERNTESGTIDIKAIDHLTGAVDYATKAFCNPFSYERYIALPLLISSGTR